MLAKKGGEQWCSGEMLDFGAGGRGFESLPGLIQYLCVSLSKTHKPTCLSMQQHTWVPVLTGEACNELASHPGE
jgi:hypothetical protein